MVTTVLITKKIIVFFIVFLRQAIPPKQTVDKITLKKEIIADLDKKIEKNIPEKVGPTYYCVCECLDLSPSTPTMWCNFTKYRQTYSTPLLFINLINHTPFPQNCATRMDQLCLRASRWPSTQKVTTFLLPNCQTNNLPPPPSPLTAKATVR